MSPETLDCYVQNVSNVLGVLVALIVGAVAFLALVGPPIAVGIYHEERDTVGWPWIALTILIQIVTYSLIYTYFTC